MRSDARRSTSSAQVLGQSWGQTDGTKVESGTRATFGRAEVSKCSQTGPNRQSALPKCGQLVLACKARSFHRLRHLKFRTEEFMLAWELIVVVLLILLNGFFAMSEL